MVIINQVIINPWPTWATQNAAVFATRRIIEGDLHDWRNHRQKDDGGALATINRSLAVLTAYAHWLDQAGYTKNSRNPIQGIKVVKETEPLIKTNSPK